MEEFVAIIRADVTAGVQEIIESIKARGDDALRAWTALGDAVPSTKGVL